MFTGNIEHQLIVGLFKCYPRTDCCSVPNTVCCIHSAFLGITCFLVLQVTKMNFTVFCIL